MSTSQQQDSKGKLLPWAGAIIVALLGTNAYLWMNKNTADTKLVQTTTELDNTKAVKDSLQKVYDAAVVELEAMKGKNVELNNVIEQQKANLLAQKSKIDATLASGGKDKKELQAALRQIEEFKSQVAGYMAQVEDLKTKLATTEGQLKTEVAAKEEVTKKLNEVSAAKQEIDTKLATTTETKTKLEEEKKELSSKVDVASVIRVNNFDDPMGFEVSKKNGKESQVSKTKNMERIRFCFDAQENRVAKSGSETFHIAVQDPTGVTIEGPGSGVAKLSDGTEGKYTFVHSQELANNAQKVCTSWDPANKLTPGTYQIVVYNKGYVAGKHSFTFKK